jgi:hypothetical protein
MVMSSRLKTAIATGGIFKLAEVLDGWSTEELQALLVDANAQYGEFMKELHGKQGEALLKPAIFFNDKAASEVNEIAHKAEIDVLGVYSEICSVAMMVLEERGIIVEDPDENP